jgi:diaminopimelate decarboxylase
VRVWLRLNPDAAVKTHHAYTVTGTAGSKFGLPLAEAETLARELVDGHPRDPLRLTGLHFHLGSNFRETGPVLAALAPALDLAARLRAGGWEIEEICPGGGLAVPYLPDDEPAPVEPFVRALASGVEAACRARGFRLPRLVLEPGRSLVARAGVALYTVGARKVASSGSVFVSVDGGLADNPRPALYQAGYTALLADRAGEPPAEAVAVAGRYCESGDILIGSVWLPYARPGDVLAVPVAGAYQLSMASNYNGALRPVVLFMEGGQATLAQRRETLADLVQRDV